MNFIKLYINLCLFKASPADIPASKGLLQITLFAYFLVGTVIGLLDNDIIISLWSSLADTLVLTLVIAFLLRVKGFPERFTQTVTALAGAGICMGIVAFPIIAYFYSSMVDETPSALSMVLMVIMMFWSLMVTAHVFRASLEIKPGLAAFLTVIYTLFTMMAVGLVVSGVA